MITIYAVLRLPNGNLMKRESTLNGCEGLFKSVHPVVAVFTKKTVDGQDFWDEYSGNSMYSVIEGDDEIVIAAHDITPSKTRKRGIGKVDEALTPWEQLDSKLADAVMGGGASWVVFEDGQGSLYEATLQDAKVLVGYPVS